MKFTSRRSSPARPLLVALGAAVFLSVLCSPALAGRKHIYSDLYNIDLLVPGQAQGFYPNDLHIIIYGIFPGGAADVVTTFANEIWGQVLPANIVYTPNWMGDPTSPGFTYDQLELTYSGPDWTPLDNTMQHFGVHLKPCCYHVYIVVFWTHNGQPLWGPSTPTVHIYKIRVNGSWLVVVSNPTPTTIQLAQPRWFRAVGTQPRLAQLLTGISPDSFFDVWHDLDLPVPFLEPRQSRTFRIPNTENSDTPLTFQVQVTNGSQVLATATDRATSEWNADSDGTGTVGILDFLKLQNEYNKLNPDDVP